MRPNARGAYSVVDVNFKQTKVHLFISLHRYPAVFTSTFFQWQHKTKQRAVQFERAFLRDSTHVSPEPQIAQSCAKRDNEIMRV